MVFIRDRSNRVSPPSNLTIAMFSCILTVAVSGPLPKDSLYSFVISLFKQASRWLAFCDTIYTSYGLSALNPIIAKYNARINKSLSWLSKKSVIYSPDSKSQSMDFP